MKAEQIQKKNEITNVLNIIEFNAFYITDIILVYFSCTIFLKVDTK